MFAQMSPVSEEQHPPRHAPAFREARYKCQLLFDDLISNIMIYISIPLIKLQGFSSLSPISKMWQRREIGSTVVSSVRGRDVENEQALLS